MKMNRSYLFGTTVLAGVMAISAPALAQSTQPEEQVSQVEEIVVTGSRIRRDPTTSPTPLIQVQREALLETGAATVVDYLASIPALSNSQIPSDTTGFLNGGGLALANLRALGAGRTLTLVDGRRHVGSQGATLAVDVDTIPRLLIENIEIVTGGASSVYGADAVSGVLNFTLRKDFEGVEMDANYAWINEDGQASKRFSALVGRNFFDDRLNVYAFGEYEAMDPVDSLDMDWLRRAPVVLGTDADPTSPAIGPNADGVYDNLLFTGVRRLDRPRWGQTTLANAQQPTASNNPLVTQANCGAYNAAACYSVDPAKTWWFDGTTARLANFGSRVGTVGANRPYNIGGDGDNPSTFSANTRLPDSESQRFQVGANLKVTSNVTAYVEAKYVNEDTYLVTQPSFFDWYLSDSAIPDTRQVAISGNNAIMRWSDNAFIPANLKAAIAANTVTNYGAPTLTEPGAALAPTPAPWARHVIFGPDRTQTNNRELQRYVVALKGDYDQVGFVKNFGWDLSYTYGSMDNINTERGVDVERLHFAADSVFDTAGVLGAPGAIVCRAKLLDAQGVALPDPIRGGTVGGSAEGRAAIDECTPLNVFGAGNQSAEGLAYIDAAINVRERNEQHDAVAVVSGQLWDFWGAGAIGVALGAEYRKEYTEAIGRSSDTGNRRLQLNTGADFLPASYETTEGFAELSVPLFRDSMLGEYAELSGTYRYSDYTTVGGQEVYGVNLVYRPIPDIAFKTSLNTSIRVPTLSENFRPLSETFWNSVVDPCDTRQINGSIPAEEKANRIKNCTALAAQMGLSYDFAGDTASTEDDYRPLYSSGISGQNGGSVNLRPEESESFTFSVVLKPRFIPNFSMVLDYYEIRIDDVIASVSAATVAENCVKGPSLNELACADIFRKNAAFENPTNAQERSEAFKIGAPSTDPIGAFIQRPLNYAKREVRGLDFGANYRVYTEEFLSRNWGVFDYRINGSWLIQQDNYNNVNDPGDVTSYAGYAVTGGSYPRVRFTSALSWSPNETWRVTWTADWQSSQHITKYRDFISNMDARPVEYLRTGDFVRNDLLVRWNVRDNLSVRAGVTNIFDAEQAPWLGNTIYSNFDPYGRRFNIGLNYRPW
ncbi:TonB-dependent receptor domain-containing protein [Brevundimonas naejangsanensis]|uniref:TonB-dependent receptor domain-containing protein n=1 Tax=Brevundimonas naejangsanensis TaxID=588932 RepID=UPI0003FE0DE0|nr:TonB-dependent receptor [Brevundimonas naejangsanensis]